MAKYFAFSIDDGTIYDGLTIALFNRFGIRATFNLNSGLSDYVWYLDGRPIRRFNLEEAVHLYDGHEVASHTLHHPDLAYLDENAIRYEVGADVENLRNIFHRDVTSFATPFESCGEREISAIREVEGISAIRMSKIDESFSFPRDPYHIKCTCFEIDRALTLLDAFLSIPGDAVFVYAGHSYDFALQEDGFPKLERLIKVLIASGKVEFITMAEIAGLIKQKHVFA